MRGSRKVPFSFFSLHWTMNWKGMVALWFRLRFAAIGPAIAVHFAYNAILACFTVWATGW